MAMWLCVVQSRLRLTTTSPRRRGSREGAEWGAVERIAAASAVTLTRRATGKADGGPSLSKDPPRRSSLTHVTGQPGLGSDEGNRP